ncbi:Predicted ATPase [Thermomonospora echinospora]|uniref:Predicted ATPase n=1 Tax=Thermomonospora echinospora TaxID=1992 RepID=A0A1H6AZB2_9ACTN|nr:BTAD domain-containing putative transcriptional regulator [Thermomonospora echinospora]SEG53949.1 Predicted ATPase [Thermomonospora echinospora]
MVRFGVLGPLSAELDGCAVKLGGLRQRAVLAVLLIARGRVVSAEQIVSAVWEGFPPPSSTTLHAYVSELRRALEPGRAARAPARLLVREGPGYVLRVAPDMVDAERFTDLAARGRRALEAGEHEKAEDLLGQALDLWRGPAYAEFAETGFAAPEVARLEDLRASVQDDRLAAMIELGRHAAAVGPLEAQVAQHPLRERGWELLALALYRSGRQADALAALRTVRRRLADELGIEPGPALRSLESAMFAQDARLDPVPAARPHPAPAPAPAPAQASGNLPFALSAFVGRASDLAMTGGLLAEHRLVTLTGPGGVGKTRLALETARQRADADGPWLVELASLSEPGLLPAAVAAALGIPGVAAADQLAAVLGGRELVLLLDNCEHLLAAAAELAGTLLARCGGLRVLATSREPLGVDGEAVYEVPPLDPAGDAAELFRRRAAAVLPGWTPDEAEQARIVALCAELDGIPLAIELAAAQCRMLSIDQVADALQDRFAVLVGGSAGGPARHRTLEDTVAWSHQLLEPAERRLFHRLGVFAGGFDLEAAGAVAGLTPVLPPLSALVRKSLLTVEPGTAPRRYRMLETLRQYALRELAPDDLALARERHRDWVLARAEAAERHLRGPQAAGLLARLSEEQAEHRAAFASASAAGDGEYMLRLGGALYWFWYRKGHIAEGISWMSEALAATPDADPGVRARARVGLGGLLYLAGQVQQAYETAVLAAAEAHEAGDQVTESLATVYQPYMGALAGVPLDIPTLTRTAVEVARRSGQDWLVAEALMIQGSLGRVLGDPSATDVLDQAMDAARACDHHWSVVSAVWAAMKAALDRGDAEHALTLAGDMIDMLERDMDVTSWLVLLHTAAHALVVTGRAEDAAVVMGAVDGIGRQVGFSPELMDPLDGPREAAAVREALPPQEYERRLAQGRRLSRREASALLSGLIVKDAGTAGRTGVR